MSEDETMTLAEIAELLEGTVEGDGTVQITGLAGLREACPGDLSLLTNRKYEAALAETQAAAVLVRTRWKGKTPCSLIRVENPDAAMTQVALAMAPARPAPPAGVHPSAVVADNAVLGDEVSMGPHCVIEAGVTVGKGTVLFAGCYLGTDVHVGDGTTLYPHVSVHEGCRIGSRTTIHDGTVIGSDGFGYDRQEDGSWVKIPQVGIVEIGDDVEIGANVTIDRARFGRTRIGNGVKLDNLIQIAHNVVIGENTAIAARTGVAGSTTIGRNVRIGGQASVIGHVTIGDNSILTGCSTAIRDMPPGSFWMGHVAAPHKEWKRIHAATQHLPELTRKVTALEQTVEELKRESSGH